MAVAAIDTDVCAGSGGDLRADADPNFNDTAPQPSWELAILAPVSSTTVHMILTGTASDKLSCVPVRYQTRWSEQHDLTMKHKPSATLCQHALS